MRILLTGATGYIGKRVLPVLLEQGHEVICCIRDIKRLPGSPLYRHPNVSLLETDFLKDNSAVEVPPAIDAAYYLVHSMGRKNDLSARQEETISTNFVRLVGRSSARQIIHLGMITGSGPDGPESRSKAVRILSESGIPLTDLRCSIIVGSGSASFEIIRDLVELLPVMVAPKWLNNRTRPIAIRNVLEYLTGVLLKEETFGRRYDLGGPQLISFREMLTEFAAVRGMKRYVFTLPVTAEKLSSFWIHLITSTSYSIACHLVDSMKREIIPADDNPAIPVQLNLLTYREAVSLAFQRIEQNNVVSSWKDSLASSFEDNSLLEHIKIPSAGCYKDRRRMEIRTSVEQVLANMWSIGGERGWYYGNWLWSIRGTLDKLWGGVGLNRGRTNANTIHTGDTVDFWRVLAADKQNRRLLLYAEMKIPGEAWLEFRIITKRQKTYLQQTATFRPVGLAGRLYWYAEYPFHLFIFRGMARNLIRYGNPPAEEARS